MTYKIDGTTLLLQPTTGDWVNRGSVGSTGEGHSVYPAQRSFKMQWGFMTPAQFEQIHTFFSNNNVTGTVVVDLPQYAASTYTFYAYSGCVLKEPTVGEYFEQHYSNVSLLIVRVLT